MASRDVDKQPIRLHNDRERREHALRLTKATFEKMSPKPLRSPEQVAPIVYKLLEQDVPITAIELALINARAHTPSGIQYALVEALGRHPSGQKFPMEPIPPPVPFTPSDEERSRVREIISQTKTNLKPGRSD